MNYKIPNRVRIRLFYPLLLVHLKLSKPSDMSLNLILSCCTLVILSLTADGLPQNPIVEGLRALFSTKKEGGVNLSLFEDLNIPLDLIPDEFKFIKKGLCGQEATKKCFCEEGAEVAFILFPRNRQSVTFKDIKRIFAKCRPT